ncbi:MAG TPA: PilZ domain-containing protein [Polyangiaceae bacterium]|nr:PilZ domain-containing protein [Polyangiaceae bacterium]
MKKSEERRTELRHGIDVFFNKFLDGHPYLCRAVDISRTGILFDVFTEPETRHESFPIELRLPGEDRSLWVWGRKVRAGGSHRREAVRFVSLHTDDRIALDRYLTTLAA